MKYAIVVSKYNAIITDKLLDGARTRLMAMNVLPENIEVISVPGAIEIPLTAKLLAKTNQFQAIICLGAVIRGETDHYDYVCQQVSQGCQAVMMEFELPIIFGVLTTNNLNEAHDRVGGKEGHKGIEAAEAAVHMAEMIARLF